MGNDGCNEGCNECTDEGALWGVDVPEAHIFEGAPAELSVKLFRLPQAALVACILRIFHDSDDPAFLARSFDLTDPSARAMLVRWLVEGRCETVLRDGADGSRVVLNTSLEDTGLAAVIEEAEAYNKELVQLNGPAAHRVFDDAMAEALDHWEDPKQAWEELEKRLHENEEASVHEEASQSEFARPADLKGGEVPLAGVRTFLFLVFFLLPLPIVAENLHAVILSLEGEHACARILCWSSDTEMRGKVDRLDRLDERLWYCPRHEPITDDSKAFLPPLLVGLQVLSWFSVLGALSGLFLSFRGHTSDPSPFT